MRSFFSSPVVLFAVLLTFQVALAAPETTTPVASTTVQTNVATSAPGEVTSIAPGETTTIPGDIEKVPLPGSFTYNWTKAKEFANLNLFTYRAESKAQLLDDYADQRVKEMNYAVAVGNNKALETLVQTYNTQKNNALEYARNAKNEAVLNGIKENMLTQQQEMTKIQLKIIDETIKEKFVEVQKQAAEKIQNVVAAIQGQDEAKKIFEQTRYTWVDPYFNIQQMVQQGGVMPTLPSNWEYRPYVDNAQIQTFREEMKERVMSGKPIEGFRPPWEVSPPTGGNYQPGGPQSGGYQPGSGYSGSTAPMPKMEYNGPAGSSPQPSGGYQPGYIDPNLSTAPTSTPSNENTATNNTAAPSTTTPTAPPTTSPGPSNGTAPSSPTPSGGYQQGYVDPNRPH